MKFSFRKDGKNRYLNFATSDFYRLKKSLRDGKTTLEEIKKTWVLTSQTEYLLMKTINKSSKITHDDSSNTRKGSGC